MHCPVLRSEYWSHHTVASAGLTGRTANATPAMPVTIIAANLRMTIIRSLPSFGRRAGMRQYDPDSDRGKDRTRQGQGRGRAVDRGPEEFLGPRSSWSVDIRDRCPADTDL